MFTATGILILFAGLVHLIWAIREIYQPKTACHQYGRPTPENQPTYYVMQRQFVRNRLGRAHA